MVKADVSGQRFRTAFVLILVLAISALFLAVAWPFLKALLLGAMLAGLCQPLFRWILKLCGGRRSLASIMTLIALIVIVLGPLSAFLGVVVNQALSVSDQAIPWVQEHFSEASQFDPHVWLSGKFPTLAEFVPPREQILENIATAVQAAGGFLVASASRMTAGTAAVLLDAFVMFYAMFFFFRDGQQILEKILYYMPLRHEDETRMLERLRSITRATIKGTLVIGFIQGALAGIAFWIAGIEGSAFWGTIMVVFSVIPGIGAALVWVPAVIYLYANGQATSATLLLIWCAAVVGTVDNVLRPTLVGKDAKMPDLLILVGTLGGLFLFGPIGFVVGPVVCGLFLTAWDIYGTAFQHLLPPVQDLETGETVDQSATLEENTAPPAAPSAP